MPASAKIGGAPFSASQTYQAPESKAITVAAALAIKRQPGAQPPPFGPLRAARSRSIVWRRQSAPQIVKEIVTSSSIRLQLRLGAIHADADIGEADVQRLRDLGIGQFLQQLAS